MVRIKGLSIFPDLCRAYFYGEYVKSALEHPLIIDVHWHQYMDQATTGRFDGENFQVGFLACCTVGYNLYETRFENSSHK